MNGIFFSRRLTQVIFIEHRLFLWNTTKAYPTISIHYYRRAAPKEIFDSAVRRNFPGKFKTFGSAAPRNLRSKFKVRNEYTVSHNITK